MCTNEVIGTSEECAPPQQAEHVVDKGCKCQRNHCETRTPCFDGERGSRKIKRRKEHEE